jgi:hypothetical protein
MLKNGSCYFAPEPCSSFTHFLPNGTHASDTCPRDRCCWDPATNKGQCEDKGSPGCNRSSSVTPQSISDIRAEKGRHKTDDDAKGSEADAAGAVRHAQSYTQLTGGDCCPMATNCSSGKGERERHPVFALPIANVSRETATRNACPFLQQNELTEGSSWRFSHLDMYCRTVRRAIRQLDRRGLPNHD